MGQFPSLNQEDLTQFDVVFQELLTKSEANVALLVEKAGYLIHQRGSQEAMDATTFATLVAMLAVACSGGGSPAPNPYAPRGSATPAAATPTLPASPVEGIVTVVDSEGLDKVSGFTIRTTAGASWEFEIRDLQNASEFPPAHLVEHKASASPVRVEFHLDGSVLVADRIEDVG